MIGDLGIVIGHIISTTHCGSRDPLDRLQDRKYLPKSDATNDYLPIPTYLHLIPASLYTSSTGRGIVGTLHKASCRCLQEALSSCRVGMWYFESPLCLWNSVPDV